MDCPHWLQFDDSKIIWPLMVPALIIYQNTLYSLLYTYKCSFLHQARKFFQLFYMQNRHAVSLNFLSFEQISCLHMCLGGLKTSAFSQHALVSVCFHRNANSYQKYVPKCTKGTNVGSHRNNAIANSNKTRLLVWLTY